MNRAVAVTGVGAVTCVGLGADLLFQNAVDGKSGIREGLGRVESPPPAGISPSVHFALLAIREAMRQAGWNGLAPDDGLVVATTTGQISLWESEMMRFAVGEIDADALSAPLQLQPLGSMLAALSSRLEFGGESLLVTSACSAATQAIAIGSLWVQTGKVKRCLVGGVESLSRLTVEGFRSLQLLSSASCRPFDAQRNGINLSEGAGFFCLEKKSDRPLALVSGFGFSSDAYHMTAPHPEGKGCVEAMEKALESAHLKPSAIDWVHAHGTGSKANDLSEGKAIARLFAGVDPYVSSTKSIHGHALGASGAIEAALCISALKHQTVLKTQGLSNPDPEIPLRHVTTNVKTAVRHVLKNTLGFGGNNAALVFSASSGGET